MIRTNTTLHKVLTAALVAATFLSGCGNSNFVKSNSPNNAFKDYKYENKDNASILGVGEPISTRQMKADATFSLKGVYNLESVMKQLASTYNVAVRWGNGVRKTKRSDVLINTLAFDELRAYVEDVYDVQIIREGERRLLVLPSASEPRLEAFNPGDGVSLGTAIRGLAEQCGYNLVVNENQKKMADVQVSTNLKDVTCNDAFEALLSPQGLTIVNRGDYYTIGGLPQRQWTVNLYEPVRAEEVAVNYSSDITGSSESGSSTTAGGNTSVSIKYDRDLWGDLEKDLQQMIDTHCAISAAATAPATTTTAAAAPATGNGLLPPPSGSSAGDPAVIAPVTAAAAAAPAAAATTTTEDPKTCGYVKINRNVGLIQMRAAQSVLEEADDVISRVEEIATRRLMLEARVLAVSKNRNYGQGGKLGVNRGDQYFGSNAPTGSTSPFSSTGNTTNATNGSQSISIASTLSDFLGSGDGVNGSGGGFFTVSNRTLQAAVQFLEAYGTTYELMHPRIELMDRQRATLIDGLNKKYFLITKDNESTSAGTVSTLTATEKSQFLGLQFSVSAQIGDPGEPHTVSLQLPITSLAEEVQVPDGTNSIVPVANTRLIDQQVRLRDGEIKVIGGLTKTLAIDKESGIPLMREIPVAGKLANNENISFENVEFVILLQVRREQ